MNRLFSSPMNLETLKKSLAEIKVTREHCFVLTVENTGHTTLGHTAIRGHIFQVLGPGNLEALEFMTNTLILVTFKNSSTRDDLLTRITEISYSCDDTVYVYTIHPVLPVAPFPARIQAIVTGIPHVITITLKSSLEAEMSKCFPSLSDITLKCLEWDGSDVGNGKLLLKAVTSDPAAFKQECCSAGSGSGAGEGLVFGCFVGRVVPKSITPLEAREGLMPEITTPGLSYRGW